MTNKWILPGLIVLGVLLIPVAMSRKPGNAADGMKVHDFGRIPVVQGGREKPIDTVARNLLRMISEKDTFKVPVDGAWDSEDEKTRTEPAIRWMLDVMCDFGKGKSAARSHRVFRIVNTDLIVQLGLDPKRKHYRYALDEFADKVDVLVNQWRKISVRDLEKQPLDVYEDQLKKLLDRLQYYQMVSNFTMPHLVPPAGGSGEWRTLSDAIRSGGRTGSPGEIVQSWRDMLNTYATADARGFNAAVAAYHERLQAGDAARSSKADFEAFYNRVDPFAKKFGPFSLCTMLYALAFILCALAWMGKAGALWRASMTLIWSTWGIHTLALVVRIYLSGRPPVTNLYSSALFVGWGSIALGMTLEHFSKLGVGNAVASFTGLMTLFLAPILAQDGDTMEVLQAVLDTQFWLATHVVTITLGYATTYVAGFIAVLYVMRGTMTRSLSPGMQMSMTRLVYGSLCFATFFSFVGTVLGGLWADDSWGRFWGWDPKENGALMIVLWNALILHARWGGMVRERGLANLAVIGNIIVTWSWFGTNLLGVGLHSYGFNSDLFWVVMSISLGHLLILITGLVPARLWASPPPQRGASPQ